MHIARVGTAMMLAILVAWTMPATSVPGEYSEDFRFGGLGEWDLVAGVIDLANETERPRMAHPTIENSYLMLEDDATAGNSRTRVNHTALDATFTDYRAEVIMQRDSEYIAPGNTAFEPLGWIAVTFGEAAGTDAFYAAIFRDDIFTLANYSSTGGAANILHTQTGWGDVPPRMDQTTPLPATVDEAHRYTVDIEDGTNITVHVDDWLVYNGTLPTAAIGTIGVLAREDTKVWIQQAEYSALDLTAPAIEMHRPEAGSQYVFDVTVQSVDIGVVPVIGDLTIEADLLDDTSIGSVHLYIDGELVPGATRTDLASGIHQWLIETHELDIGTHVITLSAEDPAGNSASASVAIYVVPTVVHTGPVSDTVRGLF